MGGVGWSSGGHQIMLAAMRPHDFQTLPLEGASDVNGHLKYVIMGWPVIDPLARYRLAESKGNTDLMNRHMAYFGSIEGHEAASPPHMLKRGVHVATPPTLLLQGAADEGLTRMMAEEFVELYSLAGGVIEMGKYPGEPHGFMRNDNENVRLAFAQAKSFIQRHLR
jgi:acetyl esterase/lipase